MIAPTAVPAGMEDIFFNLAACLPQVGITPRAVILERGPLVDRFAEHGLDVAVVDAGRLRDARQFVRTCTILRREIISSRCDVVFSDMPKAHLYAAIPARLCKTPALWCQAGHPDPAHWLDYCASGLPAAGVIALSTDAATAQQRIRRSAPVSVLHPGIDVNRFRVGSDTELRAQYGIDASSPLISLVGRLQPWKGQAQFLQAAALIAKSHPDARFAIVGGAILGWEGDYPQQLVHLAHSLGIHSKVIFTGHTSEVPRWMAASNIVINASDPEPFGLVVIEAMAAGCAVVAVASGGPKDIIGNRSTGLLCQSSEPRHLADMIDELLRDRLLALRLGQAARRRVEQRFTREAMAARFGDLIRETLSSSGERVGQPPAHG